MKSNSYRVFAIALSVLFGATLAAALVSAATTISTNIQTDGTLSVTGTSVFNGKVGVATTSPAYALDINGNLDFGYATNTILIAGNSVFSIPDVNTTYIGVNAGAGATGNYNTAIGYTALATAGGRFNVALGWGALNADTTSGDNETAVGLQALYSNTSGHANTAVGEGSLQTNTTGSGETALAG